MQRFRILAALAALLLPASGTTLQQLSLTDLAEKSTAIVRGKAQPTGVALKGTLIYTHYRVQVSEQWKGTPVSSVDLAVPGGSFGGRQQTFSGAPAFAADQEYIFFLWTSRTGLTQVLGLSQGAFNLSLSPTGSSMMVSRCASADRIVNASGTEIADANFSMSLSDFKNRITSSFAKATR